MEFEKSDKHTAGALDIRNVIGSLLAIYGVILLLMGIFGDRELDKTGDINANLYAGIALLAVGLGFLAWVRIRPIKVPETVSHEDSSPKAGD
ncbi:conserved hypothetical protein [metagenome]|uniref:Uncharacterized protein n=1 Tax=metagenome TaxID=256318 RepID=A0A2P2C257_9ZZZZ